tara:strand:- start:147 stop:749 length:603 start_codon:yes stop_codon:yes gene_type:complete
MLNKKIKKILIGSNNPGKVKEIRDLLPKSVNIFSIKDFKIKSPIENGKSFEENSLIKAKFFSKKTKMICLADDSGLEIDILGGAPGIYSARWAGKKNNFNKAINKVFKQISKKDKNWKRKKIKARFICSLTIFFPSKKIINSTGKVEGYISNKKKGKNGFGYDPIFIPEGSKLTFGQMNPVKKYKIDHRFKAFKKIKKFF